MIEIGQAKHSTTVIRLDSMFAHDDGLLCRRIGTTAQAAWAMQASVLVMVIGGFERYRLVATVSFIASAMRYNSPRPSDTRKIVTTRTALLLIFGIVILLA